MNFFFRFDISSKIGAGHYSRILSIAKSLKNKNCFFLVSKNTDINKVKFKKKNIFLIKKNNEEKDILNLAKKKVKNCFIFDTKKNYSKFFFENLKKYANKIIVIDKIYDYRKNIYKFVIPGFLEKKYLNSNNQKIKYGLDWVIINDKVKKIKLKKKIKKKYDILITMGSSDPNNISTMLYKFILKTNLKTVFLIGNQFKNINLKKPDDGRICFRNFDYKYFNEAKIAISAFGVTCYELLYLNIPLFVISHKKKDLSAQKFFCKNVSNAKDLGFYKNLKFKTFAKKIKNALSSTKIYKNVHFNGNGQIRIKKLILEK